MNKVIIAGGGVAGLSMAIFLQNAGWEVIVKEQATAYKNVGHGFILQPNGINVLDKLGVKDEVIQNGMLIDRYVNRTRDDLEIANEALLDNISIKRNVLLSIMEKRLQKNTIHFGYRLKSLEWNESNNSPVILGYENDEYEDADLVIGADGANSFVRNVIFPSAQTVNNRINEIVGVCSIPPDCCLAPHQLLKIHDKKGGMAIGILPCNNQELIWYLQYDNTQYKGEFTSIAMLKNFIFTNMEGWPSIINDIFKSTDFSKIHLWRPSYLELLPSFHKKNIVLMGDAAHTFLPFTSQGANSALVDADIFSTLILSNKQGKKNWENVFNQYYNLRKNDVIKNIDFGNAMTKLFIHPELAPSSEITIPFVIN